MIREIGANMTGRDLSRQDIIDLIELGSGGARQPRNFNVGLDEEDEDPIEEELEKLSPRNEVNANQIIKDEIMVLTKKSQEEEKA